MPATLPTRSPLSITSVRGCSPSLSRSVSPKSFCALLKPFVPRTQSTRRTVGFSSVPRTFVVPGGISPCLCKKSPRGNNEKRPNCFRLNKRKQRVYRFTGLSFLDRVQLKTTRSNYGSCRRKRFQTLENNCGEQTHKMSRRRTSVERIFSVLNDQKVFVRNDSQKICKSFENILPSVTMIRV